MSTFDKSAKIFGKIAAFTLGVGLIMISIAMMRSPVEPSITVYELEDRLATVEMKVEELFELVETPPVAVAPLAAEDIAPVAIELPTLVVTEAPKRKPQKNYRTAKRDPYFACLGF